MWRAGGGTEVESLTEDRCGELEGAQSGELEGGPEVRAGGRTDSL